MKRHALLLIAALCTLVPSFAHAGGGCSSQRRVSGPRPIYYPAPAPVQYRPAPVRQYRPVAKIVTPPRNVIPTPVRPAPTKKAPVLTTAQRLDAAKAALRIGHLDKALLFANMLNQQIPDNSHLLQFRSMVHFRRGDIRSASEDAYEAVKHGPIWNSEIAESLYAYPAVYKRDLRSLREDSMTNLSALFLSAYHHLVAGELEEGRDFLRRAMAIKPDDQVAAGLVQLIDQRLAQDPTQQLAQSSN